MTDGERVGVVVRKMKGTYSGVSKEKSGRQFANSALVCIYRRCHTSLFINIDRASLPDIYHKGCWN